MRTEPSTSEGYRTLPRNSSPSFIKIVEKTTIFVEAVVFFTRQGYHLGHNQTIKIVNIIDNEFCAAKTEMRIDNGGIYAIFEKF